MWRRHRHEQQKCEHDDDHAADDDVDGDDEHDDDDDQDGDHELGENDGADSEVDVDAKTDDDTSYPHAQLIHPGNSNANETKV